jgi:predicted signal transduction protein with EAL and GGDEF domain
VADGVRDDGAALALGQRLADGCAEPLSLDGEEVEVTVTLGVCRVGDAASGEEAMRAADLALYAAKTERRGTVKVFAASMRDAAVSRLTLERHLRRALDRGELYVVYQPVVAIEDSGITGMEALLRWRSPVLGDVGPADFIPIAERTGSDPADRPVRARAGGRAARRLARGRV